MPQNKPPAQLRWSFPPSIPTKDFFDEKPLTNMGKLQDAVDDFIYWLEECQFLMWEAVVCHEQGLPLTAQQEEAFDRLINFGNEDDDDQILYIEEMPRPSEPWHVLLNKLLPHLLLEPFRTFDEHWDVTCEGWTRIVTTLKEHGQGLSLPPEVSSFMDVIPADLQHRLWLQYCFDILGGLGQEDVPLLEEEEACRVDDFILRLRECKESVAYFGLTLKSLLTKVILPKRDQPVFVKMMQAQLGLTSIDEQIANRL